jgi:fructose-bisphosphate aldolase class II
MLVAGRELVARATADHCAVGSFNTYNLEITRAILTAAEAQRQPVFLAVGRGAFDHAGFSALTRATLAAAEEASVPVALHLDHSPDVATISRCIEAGFTSVMVDGSALPLEDNISLTREAVRAAKGTTLEAELGGVPGEEDKSGTHATDIPMTDPNQARRFVAETGVDCLAIAIGNAHGFYAGEPKLDFARLTSLAQAVPVPLVLHGASGISDEDIRRCIALGIRKININTEVRYSFFKSLEASLKEGVSGYDVTRLLGAAIEAMQRTVEEKIHLFSVPQAQRRPRSGDKIGP